MKNMRASFVALVAAVGAVGQEPQLPMPAFHGVCVSDPYEDGTVWVRGDRYKVGLDASVTYQPLFGPSARRDWPLHLRLRGQVGSSGGDVAPVPPWRIVGNRAELARDGVVERWDFAPEHAQQSFVIERPSNPGDLTLAVGVTTDLRVEPEGEGVTFVAPDGLGSVHYSDAVVVDAAGARIDAAVDWVDGELRIVVPSAFLVAAQWPIVVDPWLHTIAIDNSVSDMQDARVAYDETNDVWLVVAEEVLSATDSDIVNWRYSAGPGAPVLLDMVYAANSSQQTINPDIASMTEHALFVEAWYNTAVTGSLQFRRRSASTSSFSGTLTSSSGFGSDPSNRALVGGSRTGALYLVLAVMRTSSGNPFVQMRAYDVGGQSYGNYQFSMPAAPTSAPSDISLRQGSADPWIFVWEECAAGCASTSIMAKPITAGQNVGQPTALPAVTVFTGFTDHAPRIAGFGGKWLAVWQHDNFHGGAGVLGQPLAMVGGALTLLGSVVDMHAGEPNGVPVLRRIAPTISFDGVRYVVTYDEVGPSGTEPYAMTVVADAAGGVAWHDGHVALGIGPGIGNGGLDLAASTGPHLGRHFAVVQQPTTNGDLRGAVIDAYAAGVLATVANVGCGLPSEPTIGFTGTPALGRTFSVSLGNVTGLPFLMIGLPAISPLPGCGSCQQGVSPIGSTTLFGSSIAIAVPGTPAFLHLPIAFQGIGMLQVGGCPAPVFGLAFAMSDALSVEIL